MAYVYRYTDLSDNIIKYVGIVWSNNRTLKERIDQHRYDVWFKNKDWKVEYIEENIVTRTDAEYFEAHYISLYETGKWFNSAKVDWGVSNYLPNREDEWKLYDVFKCHKSNDNKHLKNSLLRYENNIIRVLDSNSRSLLIVDCIHKAMPKWVSQSDVSNYATCTEEELVVATGKNIYDYDSLDDKSKEFVHEHFMLIAGVLPFIGDEKRRCYMTRVVAQENNVSKQTIRNCLWAYLVYQDIAILAPKQKQQDKPLTYDEENMLWALREYYNNGNSLWTVYDIMLKEKYCDSHGNLMSKYPSINQLRYFNRRNQKLLEKNF